MIQITDIIEKEKKAFAEMQKGFKVDRITINISAKDFKELFLLKANKIILSRNINREFEVTDQNKEVINQLFYYIINDPNRYNGELEKGIMLVGKNGVGKTLILQSFCDIITQLSAKNVTHIHAKQIHEKVSENDKGYYDLRPMFIDDIGKEPSVTNNYGTKTQPIADLMAARYDNGALSFATSNYKLETLTDFYGLTTTDRFKEMFNIILLEGDSFRK